MAADVAPVLGRDIGGVSHSAPCSLSIGFLAPSRSRGLTGEEDNRTLVVSMNMDACHSSPGQELAQFPLCLPRPKASVRLGGMVLSDQ